MASFLKSKGFKYAKNFVIGVGAAVVLVGALFKIMSWKGADTALTIGLLVEAGLFLMLGILGPDPDYYWQKMYPGLDDYNSEMEPVAMSSGSTSKLSTETLESQQERMIAELQIMAKSMSSLKALQEADFGQMGDQVKKMGQFYASLNQAMENIDSSLEDTKVYKEQLSALNSNLGSLNKVYGNMLSAMASIGK